MTSDSGDLSQRAVELCWRQWTTLGVAGVAEQQSSAVIDPEALVLVTASLGDTDPRLRDEATDWCVRFGPRFVSATRLRNLLARESESARRAAAEFLATVNENSATRWPAPKASPRAVVLSGKSRLPPIGKHPALLRLQLRSIFGVTARAEILLEFVGAAASPPAFFTASDLVSTGYSKRNVALVLGDLALAGVLAERRVGNELRYRLVRRAELGKLAPGCLTAVATRWDLRLSIVASTLALIEAAASKSATTRGVEARRLVLERETAWSMLDLTPPEVVEPARYLETLVEWIGREVLPEPLF